MPCASKFDLNCLKGLCLLLLLHLFLLQFDATIKYVITIRPLLIIF